MRPGRYGILIAVCLSLLAADILLKAYSFYCLPPMSFYASVYPYGGIGVFKDLLGIDFCITYVQNKGAAWGILSSYQEILLYVRLALVVIMAVYLFVCKMPFFKRLSISLIVTGAVGNVVDFFAYGHVVDMFYFKFWGYSYPVFNIADACICLGVGLMFMQALIEKKNVTRVSKA